MTTKVRLSHQPTAEPFTQAAAVLAADGIVAYPTDTLYALGVDPRRNDAVEALCDMKERGAGAGLPLIAGSLEQVEASLGPLSALGRQLAERWWPGPLTLVYSPAVLLAEAVHAPDGSLAVRVPASEAARMLAVALGHPVTSTSANRRGARPAQDADALARELGPEIRLLLEHPTPLEGAPSTIVDVRTEAPTLLRAGSVPWERVLQSTRA